MASSTTVVVNALRHRVSASSDTPRRYVLHNELHPHGPRFGGGLAQCVQRLDLPGSGEPTAAPVAAAIANALYDATGVRRNRVPMTPAYVRAAPEAAR